MDNRAVTPLLGMMFILMISMLALSIIQAYQVPRLSQEAEMKHYTNLISEISELPDALMSGRQATIKIDAGLDYPDYPILLTPPTAPSTIYTEQRQLNLSYTAILPDGSQKTFQLNEKSSAIYLLPHYVYLKVESSLGIIVFEHGIIFRKGKTFAFPVTHQILFSGNKITIPVIKANISSFSTTSSINLKLIPIDVGYTVARNFSVTFTTEFGEYWNRTLKEWAENLKMQGYTVEYTIKSIGDLYVVTVKASAGENQHFILSIPRWYIGLGEQVSESRKVQMLVANPKNLSILIGSVARVDVWVFDNLGSPMRGVEVKYEISGGHLSLVSSSPVTDADGRAYFYFKGIDVGKGVINFFAESAKASVSYQVLPAQLELENTLSPIKDAYVDSSNPEVNFGKLEYLKLGSGSDVLIQFDLSSIPPNAEVREAKLRMYMYQSNVNEYGIAAIYKINSEWDEFDVTWNSKPALSEVIGYQIVPPLSGVWVEWDVTSDVQSIVNGGSNYGWLINMSGAAAFFYSREHSELSPQLIVRYTSRFTTPTQTPASTTQHTVTLNTNRGGKLLAGGVLEFKVAGGSYIKISRKTYELEAGDVVKLELTKDISKAKINIKNSITRFSVSDVKFYKNGELVATGDVKSILISKYSDLKSTLTLEVETKTAWTYFKWDDEVIISGNDDSRIVISGLSQGGSLNLNLGKSIYLSGTATSYSIT